MNQFVKTLTAILLMAMPCAVLSATIALNQDIVTDTTLKSADTYVVGKEVHVRVGVKLTIENGTLILIKNGLIEPNVPSPYATRRAALVFDTGSSLQADNVVFKACDANAVPVKIADNAGIFFLGSSSKTQRDHNITTNLSTRISNFKANNIQTEYLGGRDPRRPYARIDDFDSLQLIGLNANEWTVNAIDSIGSGDDGLDLEDSVISLKSVREIDPSDDGINLSNSRLDILENLELNVKRIAARKDRDLFDVEVDRSPSIIRIAQDSTVKLLGIFGDQLWLRSDDLPPRTVYDYQYTGKTTKGQSYIYSMTKD